MKQKHPEKYLSMYIDGLLSKRERFQVAVHLKTCNHCRIKLMEFQRLKQYLSGAPSHPLPVHLIPKVLTRYRILQQAPSFWNSFDFVPRLIQPAALVLFFASLALLIMYPSESDYMATESSQKYTIPFESTGTDSTLTTDEQALRFALNEKPIFSTGDGK